MVIAVAAEISIRLTSPDNAKTLRFHLRLITIISIALSKQRMCVVKWTTTLVAFTMRRAIRTLERQAKLLPAACLVGQKQLRSKNII
jgi:hypothetical protein